MSLKTSICLVFLLLGGWFNAQAEPKDDAIAAVTALSAPLEKKDFTFRAEPWVKYLQPTVGKGIKVQLFKGNEYRFCIAVPPDSGVEITAAVLDFEGKPGGKLQPVEDGWGLILEYEPKKTGVYLVAIRQLESGTPKPVVCAMVTGYK